MQALGRAGHAAFGNEGIQGRQQVEVEPGKQGVVRHDGNPLSRGLGKQKAKKDRCTHGRYDVSAVNLEPLGRYRESAHYTKQPDLCAASEILMCLSGKCRAY